MVIHHVLNEVFRSRSHVAVLRALLDTTSGFTGNHVGRTIGMHPRSALRALSVLEDLGLVRRQRGGRDHIFTLNRKHFLVRRGLISIFSAERTFEETLFSTLANTLQNRVASAVVFGSVARQQEEPRSDLDLCCIVQDDTEKETVRDVLDRGSGKLHTEYGVRLAPFVLTIEELRKKRQSTLVTNMVEHGRVIAGNDLTSILNGQTPGAKTRR